MWLIHALLGTLGISCMYLVFKRLTQLGVAPAVLLLYLFTLGALFYLVHVLATKTNYSVSLKVMPLLFAAAACSYLGNYFNTRSIELAPNPGYTAGIGALQIVIVSVVSVYLFGADLSASKLSGITLAVLGVVLIGL